MNWGLACAAAVMSLTCAVADAQTLAVMPLWPEGVPGAKPGGGEERIVDDRVVNVQNPTLTVFPAAPAKATGAAVIMCPGGGYVRLAITKEGNGFARVLNDIGVTVFILKYRLVEYGHPAPLQDVLRAVRLVRSRAAEFGVDPARIGVMGTSAGGHLTASAATLFDAPEGRTGAPLDAVSARPDFVAMLYPVITMKPPFAHMGSRKALLGAEPSEAMVERMSVETQVTAATPPAFLVHTAEDTSVPLENSILFYQALRRLASPSRCTCSNRAPTGSARPRASARRPTGRRGSRRGCARTAG